MESFLERSHGSLPPAMRRSSGQRNRIASPRRQPRREASCFCRGVGRAAGSSRTPPPHRSVPPPPTLTNITSRVPDSPICCQRGALAHAEQRFPMSGKRCCASRPRGSVGVERFLRREGVTSCGGAPPGWPSQPLPGECRHAHAAAHHADPGTRQHRDDDSLIWGRLAGHLIASDGPQNRLEEAVRGLLWRYQLANAEGALPSRPG
jgi:hypothetical protein